MQAQAKEGFIFFRVNSEFLQFVEDVAVEETLVGAVDVKGAAGGEARVDLHRKDLFQGPKGAKGPKARRGGQGRVTSNGTILRCLSARPRRSWAMLRSWACQSGSWGVMGSSLRTRSPTSWSSSARFLA